MNQPPRYAYYNEHDARAAAWLRELIRCGHIAPGEVDERDIRDVLPTDLSGFAQHHFFAGIGVWSYALRRAGWADDRPVATASCPCQPFSAAGAGIGFADERHLWPAFYHLARECGFPVVIGEQVASKDGLAWLDLVQADMEGAGYTGGAVDICSAGFGAPHIRQRLHFAWMADLPRSGFGGGAGLCDSRPAGERGLVSSNGGGAGGLENRPRGLVDADGGHSGPERQQRGGQHRQQPEDCGPSVRLVDAVGRSVPFEERGSHRRNGNPAIDAETGLPGPVNGFWGAADWLHCRDLKWRAVEPGTFPLAHGVAARMGRLRGYGNAINAEVAVEFIEAVMAEYCGPERHDFARRAA